MEIGKHLVVLLFVIIVNVMLNITLNGSGGIISVRTPAPPSSTDPFSIASYLGNTILFVFLFFFDILRFVVVNPMIAILPEPFNIIVTTVFLGLFIYGFYPILIMLIQIMASILRAIAELIGQLIPF